MLVLGEDVGVDGGVFRVTDGLLDEVRRRAGDRHAPGRERHHRHRASAWPWPGCKPVCEMQFSGFSYLMMGQFEGHATRMRAAHPGPVHRAPGGPHALRRRRARPGAPQREPRGHLRPPARRQGGHPLSGPRNARALLVAAIRDPDPVVFMEPKHSYRAFREEVPEEEEVMPIGKAQVVQEGTDLTLVSWGAMMRPDAEGRGRGREEARREHRDHRPADHLAPGRRHHRRVGDARPAAASWCRRRRAASACRREIIARINDKALLYLEAPVKRLTGYDVVTPYFGREKSYLPNAARVVAGHRGDPGFLTGGASRVRIQAARPGRRHRRGRDPQVVRGARAAPIVEDEPLVDVETDKAAVTIPSPRGGTIAALKGKVGDIVNVGDVVVVIDDGTGEAGGRRRGRGRKHLCRSRTRPQPAAVPEAVAPAAPARRAPPRARRAGHPPPGPRAEGGHQPGHRPPAPAAGSPPRTCTASPSRAGAGSRGRGRPATCRPTQVQRRHGLRRVRRPRLGHHPLPGTRAAARLQRRRPGGDRAAALDPPQGGPQDGHLA